MIKVPRFIRVFFPSILWKMSEKDKVIYLTFDDGPTPDITNEVTSILARYNAKATFFCLGNKVEAYRDIYESLIKGGHSIGNHSYDHPLGWKKKNHSYLNDIEKANKIIDSNLYRPPYGKMRWSQYRKLKKKFKIVLWDVIPGDYRKDITVNKLVNNILNNVSNGSIVVLHDNEKCSKILLQALPIVMESLKKKGYSFNSIRLPYE